MSIGRAFFAWRDRMLASRRFQRLAASFILTRPIVARRTRQLFDICAGFAYSQTLMACVELDVFNTLASAPKTIAELAPIFNLAPAATLRLLLAATSLRLTARRGKNASGEDLFGLGELGAALRGNPGIAEMVRHHAMFYADLADPVSLLRGTNAPTKLSSYWPYAKADPQQSIPLSQVADYTNLMSASQSFVAEDVLDAYSLQNCQKIMDVGGGDGTFVQNVAQRYPKVQVALFDLPSVAEVAKNRFATAGLGGRATALGGNFRTGALPTGYDVISLIRVIHDHDDDVAQVLFRNVFNALPPYGVLLLAEPFAEIKGGEAIGAAYFGFYLLAMGSGRTRSFAELSEMLKKAGFTKVRQISMRRPLLTGLIIARRGIVDPSPLQ